MLPKQHKATLLQTINVASQHHD